LYFDGGRPDDLDFELQLFSYINWLVQTGLLITWHPALHPIATSLAELALDGNLIVGDAGVETLVGALPPTVSCQLSAK
jgi:hypothetical protein